MIIIKCDKCQKQIMEKGKELTLSATDGSEIKDFNLCDNCYQTLIRVLKDYLPEE